MGIGVSNWELAQAVSKEGGLGVVSGTGLAFILVARLMEGDLGGQVRRALSHFPHQESVGRILDKYYVPGGIPAGQPYKRPTMWTINPPRALNELTVVANFVEVFLAKEGHHNPVGINLMEKLQMPAMTSAYGAMLAGVDAIIMGAGIPMQMPGILDKLAQHQPTSYRLDVVGSGKEDEARIYFDPEETFPGLAERIGPINRPYFLPIISSVILAQALLKRATGSIEGFVIELPVAGGHNAPPRGTLVLNDKGEPIYGKKDEVDLGKMKELGLPFWLAGGYDTPESFREALAAGAAGIQVGTAFAYCNESGMRGDIRHKLLQKAFAGEAVVRTDPIASPTGFPFKVVEFEESVSSQTVYQLRPRVCDMGLLRHAYKADDGAIGYRCPAEPEEIYLKKGGQPEETVDRVCLCNNLASTAGFPQRRKEGYVEPPVITSGDGFVHIAAKFLKPGQMSYSAKDVLDYLTG
jgi:nitronate monooxygenase